MKKRLITVGERSLILQENKWIKFIKGNFMDKGFISLGRKLKGKLKRMDKADK